MSKSEMVAIVAGFMFIAGLGMAAQAAPPPLPGECRNQQGPWALVKVAHAQDRDEAKEADVNGDRVVCEKLEGQLDYEDNVLP